MTRERLEIICKFLHFTDNESNSNFEGPEKLFKIFPVISHLNNKFQELYLPNEDISIEESLTDWKGHVSFKQYMPLKASKFVIKMYELCDAKTGYLWSFLVYTGKETKLDPPPLITADNSKTSAIVLKLVEPLLKQGRTVWMDNFYYSPALARTL
jgi:hypothetical protein